MLLKHAKANRWIVVAIFCDEDYSGIDNDRPEYNKCLRFCEVGKTDIVLCKMRSRFTRDMEHVWGRTTIRRMLNDVVYIRHLAQSGTTTQSYKNKKVIYLPKEQWGLCKNTHEPIIDTGTCNKT